MTTTDIHPKLQNLIDFAPVIKSLFHNDVAITVTDLEQVIFNIESEDLKMQSYVGHKLTPEDPMMASMKQNKTIKLHVPKEAYGTAFSVACVPVPDQGRVIGGVAISSSLEDQENLVHVAEQLASSSEEISASTAEMSSSASELMNFMNQLSAAYSEMIDQMNQTEKILELINSIAQSSRILGLNAGIEAARSGEHGRGFSIVAKEITKLADRSAESVDQIRQLLYSIKEKGQYVSQTVGQTLEISEHQSTAITEISDAIQHLTDVAEKVEDMAKNV